MEYMRKPYQGVLNIIKFNWHFYLIAIVFVSLLLVSVSRLPVALHLLIYVIIILVLLTTTISLLVSHYIYDRSDLYKLNWLDESNESLHIITINAGFDETSNLLASKFTNSKLIVLDFYNPVYHTEVSIKRARKAYAPFPNTIKISTSKIPLTDNSADKIFLFLAAHEIRKDEERIIFFEELKRVLKTEGEIYVIEHLRDTPNFLAYNIGFFHFLPQKKWMTTFQLSGLKIRREFRITPFIKTFILTKNGIRT